MNRSDSDDEQSHVGYQLEAGIVARVREWTDVFPWLRLGRTLRVAGSPPLILIVAVTFAAWWPVFAAIIGSGGIGIQTPNLYSASADSLSFSPQETVDTVVQHTHQMIPTAVFDVVTLRPQGVTWWRSIGGVSWSLLIWVPAVLLLVRQGAILTAGRSLTGLRRGCTSALQQTPVAWLIAAVPLACVLAMALLILITGWIARLCEGIFWIEAPLAVLVILAAIPCGLLAFGANIAVPLGWAAVANERDRDTLDSLSRGYEYLLRRPLQLALYAAISLVILTIVGALASAVAHAAILISVATLEFAGTSPTLPQMVTDVLGYFPLVVMLTLFWSLVGGVYLLIRYDAGGQEVEDLWLPTPDTPLPLPQRSSLS